MMHAHIGMMRRPITKRQALGKAEIEERAMTKPVLFRRLDAGIDRRSCHATIVASAIIGNRMSA
jgi:hypothetical protein